MSATEQTSYMDFPAYAAKWTKLQELRAELTAINDTITAALGALTPLPASDKDAERRAKLLGDAVKAVDDSALDRGKLGKLYERRRDLIAVIAEQERRVRAEQGPIDTEICAQSKPEHDRLARAVCDALIVLQSCMKSYGSFTDRLNSQGVAWSGRLRPAHLRALGDPADKNSRLALYLDDMAQHGIIGQDDIPAEIRHEHVTAKAAPPPLKRVRRDKHDWSAVA